MGVEIIRPRVGDLVFQLYGRPLHPELFDIVAWRRLVREDYQITLRITRTGHVITWENQDVLLTEVAAAADQELPEKRRLLDYKLRGEHGGSLSCTHGIKYQTTFQVECLAPEIFPQVHGELVAEGEKRAVLYHFPATPRPNLGPLGMISLESRAHCLFISTFHTFPEENTVVKSQSMIEDTSR